MKLILDIDEELKSAVYNYGRFLNPTEKMSLIDAINNGTPIPDNVTNGDMIKAIFDTTEEHIYDEDRMVDVYGLDRNDEPSTFYADWWHAPYKTESENNE